MNHNPCYDELMQVKAFKLDVQDLRQGVDDDSDVEF